MKNKNGIIFALALFLTPEFAAQAITNTAIAVSGTNIVLSWPSYGYESYLIQYRQTLDPTDAWSNLTNAYYANSTNRTTYTLYGLVPPPNTNGVGGGSGGGSLPPSPSMAMVAPSDNSSGAVPFAIYPPGFDLSGYNIFDPSTSEWVSGSGYSVSSLARFHPLDGGSPMDETNDPPSVTTGFFRVFHIPDWLVGFDGYTFDGPTFLPVDFASPDAPTNYVDNTTVLINGEPMDNTVFLPYDIGGTTYWGLGIYFDRVPNGTNTIQLLTTVRQSDALNGSTPYMTFSNAPQTIVIGNTISFTNWSDLISSNSYIMSAQSSITNVDWEIDIYDVNNDFVNYQTGHSDDGSISWAWDLTDYNGNPRTSDDDPFFYPYVTVFGSSESMLRSGGAHPNAGGGNTTAPAPTAAKKFPSTGGWLVAYMDNFYSDGLTNFDASGRTASMISGVNTIVGAAAEWSFPVQKFPIAYGLGYTQTNRDTSWNNLLSWIAYPQTRDFYYFGHGAPDAIGCDYNVVDTNNDILSGNFTPNSKAYLTSQKIKENVAANLNGVRPYRFVFLDGCNTANGNFAPAFGIPKQAVTGGWFFDESNKKNIRPCAFMGWNTETGFNTNGWGTVTQYWEFRKDWIATWANTEQEALDDAVDTAKTVSSWAAPSKIDATLVYYGDKELQYLQYNYGGDWPQ